MFFKRKPKNRRLGRAHVLDVKLRSTQVRAARTRMAAWGLGTVFVTVLGVYLLWRGGDWALDCLVYENKAFAIQQIDLQTDGVLAVDQLRRWAGVKPEDNLMALDLGRVKRDLELIPLVQSVSVERVLPHTLRIRVIEREPCAQINVPRPRSNGGIEIATLQIDAEGYVLVPAEARQRSTPAPPPGDLPLLAGINANELQPGRRLTMPQVQAVLQLIAAFEFSPMAGLAELKRIDVSTPEVLVITTGQGSEITFGLADIEQQLRRWQAVFIAGQKQGKAISSLDLAIANNNPARWVEASAVPPVTPKARKPLNSKKHHV